MSVTTPIERARRTRSALLELWPILEAADAYARDYDHGTHGASFVHGALYAASVVWQKRHGEDRDLYSDLDEELHKTIEARGDLNERILRSVTAPAAAVEADPRGTGTVTPAAAPKVSPEEALRTIRFHVQAALPPLAQLGGDEQACKPFVGYVNKADHWHDRGLALLQRTLEQFEDSFDVLQEVHTLGRPVEDILHEATEFFGLATATVSGLRKDDAARDLVGTWAVAPLYGRAKALHERLCSLGVPAEPEAA